MVSLSRDIHSYKDPVSGKQKTQYKFTILKDGVVTISATWGYPIPPEHINKKYTELSKAG